MEKLMVKLIECDDLETLEEKINDFCNLKEVVKVTITPFCHNNTEVITQYLATIEYIVIYSILTEEMAGNSEEVGK